MNKINVKDLQNRVYHLIRELENGEGCDGLSSALGIAEALGMPVKEDSWGDRHLDEMWKPHKLPEGSL